MDVCGIHDLCYNGWFFTWNNKQAGDRKVLSKIDRVLGNDLWDDTFPSVNVSFLHAGKVYAVSLWKTSVSVL